MKTHPFPLLLLVLAGCTGGAPDDVLLILGEAPVAAPGGAADVVLERRLHDVCHFDELEGTEPFERIATQRPEARGGYAFEVYRAQAQPGGERACFRVRAEDHARSEIRTQLHAGDARLPPLLRWDEAPASRDGRWSLPAVPALPEGNLRTAHWVEWQLDTAAGPAWREEATAPLGVSAPLLEDFGAARLHVRAVADVLSFEDGVGPFLSSHTDARLTLDTPSVALDGAGAAPLSRGAGCLVGGAVRAPCPLTDGALTRVALYTPGTAPRELEVRWQEARAVRTLVLRGLEDSAREILVEVASGETGPWNRVATLPELSHESEDIARSILATPGRWLVVPLGGVTADRLRLTTPGSFSLVRELSVFE